MSAAFSTVMAYPETSARIAGRHLLDVDTLDRDGIIAVLDEAERIDRSGLRSHTSELAGRVVVNLFYEPSTRTRVSFEIAARRLGAEVVNVFSTGSSIEKGESVIDTVRTLEALGADAVVVRHQGAGLPYLVARHYRGAVVNAGDGRHAHPTQALLDLLTMRRRFGELRGLRVAMVGDIVHSRVARSTTVGLLLCGAEVRLVGPRPLLPPPGWLGGLAGPEGGSVTHHAALAEGLRGAQVVMALRMQTERQSAGLLPPVREYVRLYGLSRERLQELAPDALLMHPGPVNPGVELVPDLIASPGSLIQQQVAHGVLVRMAVLRMLLGGGRE